MHIKINSETKIIEEYSDSQFPVDATSHEFYQMHTTFKFNPSLIEGYWGHTKGHVFEFKGYKDKRAFKDNQYFYDELISLVVSKKISRRLQYKEIDNGYKLWFIDGGKEHVCIIYNDIHSHECLDFELNYKTSCNSVIDITEEGTGLLQFKPREVEATLYLVHVYFQTGDSTSLDQGEETIFSIYTHIPGKTIIRFSPSYGYYITGGGMRIISGTPLSSIRCILKLAPDIPVDYGGNVTLIHNKRLFTPDDAINLLTPSKYVKYYDLMPEANVIETTLEHDENDNVKIEIYLNIYR